MWRLGERTAKSQNTLLITLCFTTVLEVPTTFSWCSIVLFELDSDFFTQFLLFLQLPRGREPFGVVQAASESQARLQHENRSLDFVHWFTEQALHCEVMRIPLVLVFPEDFGGNAVSGPSSLWCMQGLRDLEGFREARRGAGFLCQLAGADLKRPLGIVSNLPELQRDLRLGWPTFSQDKELVMYTGPLSKTCPCKIAHLPMVGISSNHKFNTSSNVLLGTAFWRRIFAAIRSSAEPPLRMETYARLLLHFQVTSFLCLFILFLLVVPLPFLGIWRAPGYCFLPALEDLWRFQRSAILVHCRVASLCVFFGFVVRLLLIRRGVASSGTPSVGTVPGWTPTRTSSRSGCTTEGPLAAWPLVASSAPRRVEAATLSL